MGFRALLAGLLTGKPKADPEPMGPKRWWELAYLRPGQALPPTLSLQDLLCISYC